MVWIFLSTLLVLLVFSPGFRVVAIYLSIVATIGAGALFSYGYYYDKKSHEQAALEYRANLQKQEAQRISKLVELEKSKQEQIKREEEKRKLDALVTAANRSLINKEELIFSDIKLTNPTRENQLNKINSSNDFMSAVAYGKSKQELILDIMSSPFPDDFHFTGRIKNTSGHILNRVAFKIFVLDCPSSLEISKDKCEVLSEVSPILGLSVPSKQARDFNFKLPVPNLIIKHNLAYEYGIDYIEGFPGWVE